MKVHKTWVCEKDQNFKLSKASDISSATAWVALDLLKNPLQFCQVLLSEGLQLTEKTWNRTRNQKKDHISQGYSQISSKILNCRPLPNILKYMDHRCDFLTSWKIFFQTHVEEVS